MPRRASGPVLRLALASSLALSSALPAETPADSLDAKLLRARELLSQQQRRSDLALPLTLEVVEEARDRGDPARLSGAWRLRGRALWAVHRIEEALRATASAVEAAGEAARADLELEARRQRSSILIETGRLEEAEDELVVCLELAEREGDTDALARLHNAISVAALQRGHPRAALDHGLRALEHVDLADAGDAPLSASTRFAVPYNLARLAIVRADVGSAASLLERAWSVAEESGHLGGQWHVLHESGALYRELGDPERSERYFGRALDVAGRIDSRDPRAQSLAGLAELEATRGRFERAVVLHRESIDLLDEISFAAVLPGARVALGRTLRLAGRLDEARQALDLAVRAAESGAQSAVLARALLERSRIELEAGRRELAARDMDAAIGARPASRDAAPDPDVLAVRARLAERSGETERAEGLYERAIAVVAERIETIGSPELRFRTAAVRRQAEEGLFRLHWRLRGAPGEENRSRAARALAVLERERARHLADLRGSPIAPALRTAASRLRARWQSAGSEERKDMEPRLDDLERAEHAAMVPRADGAGPRDDVVRAVRSVLHDDETVVVFGPMGEVLPVFVMRHDGLDARELRPGPGFERRLVLFSSLLAAGATEGLSGVAAGLSRDLLAPLDDTLPATGRLLFVASGELSTVPLDVLPDPRSPERRILDRFETATLPALSLLLGTRRETSSAPRGLLAVGPPAADVTARVGLPALPGAMHEMELLRRRSGDRSLFLVAVDDPEAGFRAAPPAAFRLLHFATHALVDPGVPARSSILLGAPTADHDGRLELGEIFELALAADVVVLSGCRTAAGRTSPARGVLGLGSGFLGAGARSVVGSLWPVEDAAAVRLVDELYRQLGSGRDVGAALRAARRSLGDDSAAAAFVLLGDPAVRADPGRPSLLRRVPWTAVILVAFAGFASRRAFLPARRAPNRDFP